MSYCIGVDIGGTAIKTGLIDCTGRVLRKTVWSTETGKGSFGVIANIAKQINKTVAESGFDRRDIAGIGVGCPGVVDSERGIVRFSANLGWDNVKLTGPLEKLTDLSARLVNDAEAAMLGEVAFGAGRTYRSFVMLTLGTGVGGGYMRDGKISEAEMSNSCEPGHIIINMDGEMCSCGMRGCLEAYASATALIRDTKRAMEGNRDSLMWRLVNDDLAAVDGKTAFSADLIGDKAAGEVIGAYIRALGTGIISLNNIFRPEAFILGGGISGQRENLTDKLKDFCSKYHYGFKNTPVPDIETTALCNDAGMLGAARLLMEFQGGYK